MAQVHLDHLGKRFGDVIAVDDVTLHVADGEFVVLLGPSGCGKSTVLRMIAGLEEPTTGTVTIGDEIVNGLDAKERDVAMVFQNYALYPNMSVRKNIAFPLGPRGIPRAEQQRLVDQTAESLGLGALLDRKPAQLSGGQRQRVALARAIVREPRVFLMDEPLSNLDAKLRSQTRVELVALQHRLRTTFVYVTHDQVEAMTMADRIAIFDAGRLQQVGSPSEVYARPANLFVARFVGSPPMNTLPASAHGFGGDHAEHTLGVRPEHLHIDGFAGGRKNIDGFAGGRNNSDDVTTRRVDTPALPAFVRFCESLGHEKHVTCRVGGADVDGLDVDGIDVGRADVGGVDVIVRLPGDAAAPSAADAVSLRFASEDAHWFDAQGVRIDDGARVVGGNA